MSKCLLNIGNDPVRVHESGSSQIDLDLEGTGSGVDLEGTGGTVPPPQKKIRWETEALLSLNI